MDAQLVNTAAEAILDRIGTEVRASLVLGSGWNVLIDSVEDPIRIPYAFVPGMAQSSVLGHAGEWVFGRVGGKKVLIMSGRLHYYEGHDIKRVVFPVRVMKRLGVQTLVLTNAAGAVNKAYGVCDLMALSDHINLSGQNPLIGKNDDEFGLRFPDMSRVYDERLRTLAGKAAKAAGITLHEGVYAWFTGPSFETPAEIRMARTLGADAVGMSTVPEAITARHAGMDVLALSCVTNMAAGVLDQPLSHAEVLEATEKAKCGIGTFMENLIPQLF